MCKHLMDMIYFFIIVECNVMESPSLDKICNDHHRTRASDGAQKAEYAGMLQ